MTVFKREKKDCLISFENYLLNSLLLLAYIIAINYFAKYSLIPAAALRPSPIARITVAAPRTISPPAQTFDFEVACVSFTRMCPFLSASSPGVV